MSDTIATLTRKVKALDDVNAKCLELLVGIAKDPEADPTARVLAAGVMFVVNKIQKDELEKEIDALKK